MDEFKVNPKKIILNLSFALFLSFLGLALVAWFFHRGSFALLFRAVRPTYLLIAVGLTILDWLLEALRIQKIVHALGNQIEYRQVLKISLMGSFFSKITPFDTGGEPFEMYLLRERGLSFGESAAVIMIKTLLGHFARLFLGMLLPFLVIIFWKEWLLTKTAKIIVNVGLFFYLSFVSVLLFVTVKPQKAKQIIFYLLHRPLFFPSFFERVKKILSKLSKVVDDFEEAREKILQAEPKDLAVIGVYSLVCWILVILVPVALLYGMGIYSPILHTLAIGIVFYIATAYAPTPGSSGVAELGFATLFAVLVPKPLLGIFVLIWRLLTYYASLLIGGVLTFKEVLFRKFKAGKQIPKN